MEIKTSVSLDAVLRGGFQGKAVELMANYAHQSTLLKMRADLDRRLKLVSGPLYLGEAESTLLLPLCNALRFATSKVGEGRSEVARHAYQLAASYALIFDVSKISQSRELANQITLSSIALQPIIKRMLDKTDRKDETYKEQMQRVWQGITKMMTNVVYRPDNIEGHETPLYMLFQATSGSFTKEVLEQNAMNTWDSLLTNLRHGKGTPLDRTGRRTYMAILTEAIMRIDLLIDAAQKEEANFPTEIGSDLDVSENVDKVSGSQMTTAFIDAYTAMYWLTIYLEAISQYDVVFPSSDLMVQSQAWVLVIKTQSAKLKKLFVDIAQVAAAYDVFTAIKMWEEVRKFYDPLLNHSLSAVSNMDSIWADNVQKAEKLLSMYAKSQVDTMFGSFKSYMDADYLLPESQFTFASDVVKLFKYPEKDADGVYTVPTGRKALETLSSLGEKSLGIFDRDLLIPGLANSAGDVELALAFIKRSREILQLTEELDDIYHALIPSGIQWDNPYALEGKVTDMAPATFTFKDPMQLCYEKYAFIPQNNGNVTAITSIDWFMSSMLMKPFYRVPQLQTLAENRSAESRILWPGIGELPVGDIITAEYVPQPIPACYTASRNANFVNNDFSAYLTLMSGHSGVTAASRDMFRKLGAILDKYETTYARGILDALAATMFVYRSVGDGKWEPLTPTVPTIYGVPTKWMMQANEVKLSNATEDVILRRSTRVSLDNGHLYQFVLHNKMPKPGPMMYISYPYTKGVYLQVPLMKDIFKANQSSFTKVMKVQFTSNANAAIGDYSIDELCTVVRELPVPKEKDMKSYFISTLGWAPYLINLPHILCSYQDEEEILLSEEYKKYALMSVRVRYDAVERAIYVGGFMDNPVELLTVEDYEHAVSSSDPSPLAPSAITDVPDTQPDTKEPSRSEAERTPGPATLGAAPRKENGDPDGEEELKMLGKVTQAPQASSKNDEGLVHGDPAGSSNKVGAKDADADALAGNPGNAARAEGDDDSAASGERFWKRISSSGEVEDVVKAKECPSGYVPASEDEYREFRTKAAKDAAKEEA